MKCEKRTTIILASASPRRRELLKQIGMDFQVIVSNVAERITTEIPFRAVEELSEQKAMCCLEELRDGLYVQGMGLTAAWLVIGADTVVAHEGRILGKPADEQEAAGMLRSLQGSSHQVYTGVTLLYYDTEKKTVEKKTFHEATAVHFYPMTEQEIVAYVSTKDPLDKAGAYGIQGICAKYIRGIEGDYNNVVGLPVARLYQEAKDWL